MFPSHLTYNTQKWKSCSRNMERFFAVSALNIILLAGPPGRRLAVTSISFGQIFFTRNTSFCNLTCLLFKDAQSDLLHFRESLKFELQLRVRPGWKINSVDRKDWYHIYILIVFYSYPWSGIFINAMLLCSSVKRMHIYIYIYILWFSYIPYYFICNY